MARSGFLAERFPGFAFLPRGSRVGRIAAIALAVTAPLLAAATFYVISRAAEGSASPSLVRAVLLVDLVYVMGLAAVIILTISRLFLARRARSAGSRLHLRLSGLFTLVALAPTVIVAVFATLTVNFGVEGWFSSQVQSVVRNALATTEAYAREHRGNIIGDALAIANELNRAASLGVDASALGDLLRQQANMRNLPEAYILDGDGEILARGDFSYLFTLETPVPANFAAARAGEVVVLGDEKNNELRALVALTGLFDNFLYITRRIDGEVLLLLEDTRRTVALYERLEKERSQVLFDFALLYLGFALLVILAAVWLGLSFAQSLANPIGRLAGAAERVGAGDFDMRVKEQKGDDEVAVLSRAFNRMTAQVKQQRDALVEANAETERRRRFIETVLAGVSAGVIGLDEAGRIDLINGAAAKMLGLGRAPVDGRPLADVASALGPLMERAGRLLGGVAQDQVRFIRGGRETELLVRVTPKAGGEGEGAVVTIDDLTDLVAAQRMAAWGDIARRIAHEIKNPLTPIQLSADRLRRKFSKLPPEDRAALNQYADVISRQAGDIRRMVDEFSKFARMPEPQRADEDIVAIVREAVLLQQAAGGAITYSVDAPEPPLIVRCDRGLISQALTNLLKNAAEAVETRLAQGETMPGEIRVALRVEEAGAAIEIADNGVGLPATDRARLTEPYVTTRAKGTGLGLAIVKKIVEQHGGTMSLDDAPPFRADAAQGACARIVLPLVREAAPTIEHLETL